MTSVVGKGAGNCNFIRATSLNLIKLSQFSPHYRNSCENFSRSICTHCAINIHNNHNFFINKYEFRKYDPLRYYFRFALAHTLVLLLFLFRTTVSLFHEKLRLHCVIGPVHHIACKRAKNYHCSSRFTGLPAVWHEY